MQYAAWKELCLCVTRSGCVAGRGVRRVSVSRPLLYKVKARQSCIPPRAVHLAASYNQKGSRCTRAATSQLTPRRPSPPGAQCEGPKTDCRVYLSGQEQYTGQGCEAMN